MSLLDRLDVPLAQSLASTMAVVRPRVTASSAVPAPTTPPPTTRMSSSVSAIFLMASARLAGDIAVTGLVDLHPVQRALDRLLPASVSVRALLIIPLRRPSFRFVPVGRKFICGRPETGRQACRVGGAQGGGFGYDGTADRHTQDVRLELHAQIVGGNHAV